MGKKAQKRANKIALHAAMVNAGMDANAAASIVNSSANWNKVWNAGQAAIANQQAQPSVTPAPQMPSMRPAPVRFETKAAEANKAGSRIRRNRKTSNNKTKLGIGKTNIQPLSLGVLGNQTINY